MKKDITSRDYWKTLANLGLAVGRENLPNIEDVAEHVLGLMRACVILLTLGYWSPGWVLDYAATYARWKFTRKTRA